MRKPTDENEPSAESRPLVIDYYTDILCVWAWIAQRRIEELEARWGDRIRICHHCVDVFGDTCGKMETQWAGRGGFDGFAEHVHSSATTYEEAPVHPDLWRRVRPTTSATAHLMLKAAELVGSPAAMIQLAGQIRRAFFVDAQDIGELPRLMDIAVASGLSRAALNDALTSGRAMARLMSEYRSSEQQSIKGSPSWVMNDGRQVLYGNVGYRILHANVEELLRHPEHGASWC